MPLAANRSGQCASCAFQIAEWLAPSIGSCGGNRHHLQQRPLYVRRHSTSQVLQREIRRVNSSRGGDPLSNVNLTRGRRIPIILPNERQAARRRKQVVDGEEGKYRLFERLVTEQWTSLLKKLVHHLPPESRIGTFTDYGKTTCHAWGIKNCKEFATKSGIFQRSLVKCMKLAHLDIADIERNPLFHRLRDAFVKRDVPGLMAEMQYSFIQSVVGETLSQKTTKNQEKIADLRYPIEWYPATRAVQRTVHLHVGPTNSGKTYHALQRLEAAESGIYAGPLRLLAHEVYTRMNAKGKLCALVTGEERRVPEGMTLHMSSCTVEMIPLNTKVEVAVIDEIQMMGDIHRGWAWTQAFLGVLAKEVHVCGELRTIDLVTELCASMGDKLIIHRYDRLGPLEMSDRSINGDLSNLRKGDAVILFSRVAIHGMKKRIEQATGKRCAIVYGSLPPETRAQQAALFNDPDNDYDFLVASDAVGMGLNLAIRRVIFETTTKYNGMTHGTITIPEIKQIAGRAGRYKTSRDAMQGEILDLTDGEPADIQPPPQKIPSKPNVGFVTTLQPVDYRVISDAMNTNVKPLQSAGIFPPAHIIARFASYFPQDTPFSYIMLRLHDIASTNPRFHLCTLHEQVEIADIIQPYKLSINDRVIFMGAPVSLRDKGFPDVITEFARCVAEQTTAHLLDMRSLNLELLEMNVNAHPHGNAGYLKDAEILHKGITLYLWLSYRFGGVFHSQPLAFHVKSLVEQKIDECLSAATWDEARQKMLYKARKQAEKNKVEEQLIMRDRAILGAEMEDVLEQPLDVAADELLQEEQEKEDFDDEGPTYAGVPTTPDEV